MGSEKKIDRFIDRHSSIWLIAPVLLFASFVKFYHYSSSLFIDPYSQQTAAFRIYCPQKLSRVFTASFAVLVLTPCLKAMLCWKKKKKKKRVYRTNSRPGQRGVRAPGDITKELTSRTMFQHKRSEKWST